MNINWFKNQDNVVYANTKEFVDNFAKEYNVHACQDTNLEILSYELLS